MRRAAAAFGLALLVCSGCSLPGPNHRVSNRPALPGEFDVVGVERTLDDRDGWALRLRNRGFRPVRIAAIRVYDCWNVAGGCGEAFDPEVVIAPGEEVEVHRLLPERPDETMSFHWEWEVWRP